MRLIHFTLTVFDSSDEEADLVVFEQVLVGSDVTIVKRRREIQVKFPADKFVVQLRTDKEFDAWRTAFVDAARVADKFYKIVSNRELGRGAFSTVFFGFDREDGHHVAVKVVDKTRCSRAEFTYAETEARMMAYVRHPSIVLCRDIFDAPDAMHVIMEYMSGSTLEQRMLSMPVTQRSFSEQTAATVMTHVLSALSYLERERICHRDIKPDNILLSTLANDALWPTSARLSDFGLAAFIETDIDLTHIVGTPHYVAPEVITRDETDNERLGYGPAVDVWASGIMMYWMLTGGEYPFDGPDSSSIFKSIRAGVLNLSTDPWNGISDDAKLLLRGLLHPNPLTRLRASSARVHPWLRRAHEVLPVCEAAHDLRGYKSRSARGRWRGAIRAVLAYNAFLETVDREAVAERRAARGERLKLMKIVGKKSSLGEKMTRAPERAPVGADGLGYNVGLIPSFAPKRRAKAGVSKKDLEERAARISRESGSDGSREASREASGERGSVDRSSVGSKQSSWGLRLRRSGESNGTR